MNYPMAELRRLAKANNIGLRREMSSEDIVALLTNAGIDVASMFEDVDEDNAKTMILQDDGQSEIDAFGVNLEEAAPRRASPQAMTINDMKGSFQIFKNYLHVFL